MRTESFRTIGRDESAFSRLRRSKRFWYLVFGTLLFLYMAFLIRWVCNDLAK